MPVRCATLLALAAALLPAAAAAHPLDMGRLDVRVAGPEIEERLSFSLGTWNLLLPPGATLGDSAATARALFEASLGRAPPTVEAGPCTLEPVTVRGGQGALVLHARGRCPAGGAVAQPLAFVAALGHPLVVTVDLDGARSERVVGSSDPVLRLERAAPPGLGSFVRLGLEHIFGGWDHLLFLLGLLLAGGSAKRLLGVVTAFTAAHSITLALAALAIVSLPGRVVEPAIAASIVVVSALNLLRAKADGRWALAFAFGLVHGFGFAGALAALALDRRALLPALVGFNLGVELGQGALVLAAAPLLELLRRRPAFVRLGLPALSLASLAVGAYWFVQRAFPG